MISVILLSNNCASTLRSSIESVLNSTYKDLELVIVDNGSTDASLRLSKSYEEKNPRVKAYSIPHTTLGGVRNFGMGKASGEWVTFLYGTDTLEPGGLEWLANHIPDADSQIDIQMIVGGVKRITGDEAIAIRGRFSGVITSAQFAEKLLIGELTPTFGGKLIRRSVNTVQSTYLDEEVEYFHEMIALVARLSSKAEIYVNTNEPVYNLNLDAHPMPIVMNFRGWQKAMGALAPFVPDGEAFLNFKLQQLYDGCIRTGAVFRSDHPDVKRLREEAKKYNLEDNQRKILKLTKSKRGRRRLAKESAGRRPNSDTLISIIMVTYNCPDEIVRAIKSIKAQTFKDWELIVIDDFSSDRTPDIVRDLAGNDPRIRLIVASEHKGRGPSRLLGINLARGEYIGFINPQDRFAPETFEKLWNKAFVTGADIVVMGSGLVSRYGWVSMTRFNPANYFKKPVYTTYETFIDLLNGSGVTYQQCDKIYRRKFLDLSRYDDIDIGDDAVFNVRTFSQPGQVAWIDYVGFRHYPKSELSIPYPKLLAMDIFGVQQIDGIMERENWENREEYSKNAHLGLINNFLNYVSQGLSQSWRGGLKRMLDDALQNETIVKGLEYAGISPDLASVVYHGKVRLRRNRSLLRKFHRLSRL